MEGEETVAVTVNVMRPGGDVLLKSMAMTLPVAFHGGQAFTEVVRQFRAAYRDRMDKEGLYFKVLQSSMHGDISSLQTVGGLLSADKRQEDRILYMQTGDNRVACSIEPGSALWPAGHTGPAGVQLSQAGQEALDRRREQEARYGAAVEELDPDRPVESNERDSEEIAQQNGADVRVDGDGFKIPAPVIARKRKRTADPEAAQESAAKKSRMEPSSTSATARFQLRRLAPASSRAKTAHSSPPEGSSPAEAASGRGNKSVPPPKTTNTTTPRGNTNSLMPTPDSAQRPNNTPTSAQRPPSATVASVTSRSRQYAPRSATAQRQRRKDIVEEDPIIDDDAMLEDMSDYDPNEDAQDNDADFIDIDDIASESEQQPKRRPRCEDAAVEQLDLTSDVGQTSSQPQPRANNNNNRTPHQPSSASRSSTAFETMNRSNAQSDTPTKFWTSDEDKLILRGLRKGWTCAQIAKEHSLRGGSAMRNRKATLLKKYPNLTVPSDDPRYEAPEDAAAEDSSVNPPTTQRRTWALDEAGVLKKALTAGYDAAEIHAKHFPGRSAESVSKKVDSVLATIQAVEESRGDFPKDDVEVHSWSFMQNLKLRRAVKERLSGKEAQKEYFQSIRPEGFWHKWKAYEIQLKGHVSANESNHASLSRQHGQLERESTRSTIPPRSASTTQQSMTPMGPLARPPVTQVASTASASATSRAPRPSPAVVVTEEEQSAFLSSSQLSRGAGGQSTLNFRAVEPTRRTASAAQQRTRPSGSTNAPLSDQTHTNSSQSTHNAEDTEVSERTQDTQGTEETEVPGDTQDTPAFHDDDVDDAIRVVDSQQEQTEAAAPTLDHDESAVVDTDEEEEPVDEAGEAMEVDAAASDVEFQAQLDSQLQSRPTSQRSTTGINGTSRVPQPGKLQPVNGSASRFQSRITTQQRRRRRSTVNAADSLQSESSDSPAPRIQQNGVGVGSQDEEPRRNQSPADVPGTHNLPSTPPRQSMQPPGQTRQLRRTPARNQRQAQQEGTASSPINGLVTLHPASPRSPQQDRRVGARSQRLAESQCSVPPHLQSLVPADVPPPSRRSTITPTTIKWPDLLVAPPDKHGMCEIGKHPYTARIHVEILYTKTDEHFVREMRTITHKGDEYKFWEDFEWRKWGFRNMVCNMTHDPTSRQALKRIEERLSQEMRRRGEPEGDGLDEEMEVDMYDEEWEGDPSVDTRPPAWHEPLPSPKNLEWVRGVLPHEIARSLHPGLLDQPSGNSNETIADPEDCIVEPGPDVSTAEDGQQGRILGEVFDDNDVQETTVVDAFMQDAMDNGEDDDAELPTAPPMHDVDEDSDGDAGLTNEQLQELLRSGEVECYDGDRNFLGTRPDIRNGASPYVEAPLGETQDVEMDPEQLPSEELPSAEPASAEMPPPPVPQRDNAQTTRSLRNRAKRQRRQRNQASQSASERSGSVSAGAGAGASSSTREAQEVVPSIEVPATQAVADGVPSDASSNTGRRNGFLGGWFKSFLPDIPEPPRPRTIVEEQRPPLPYATEDEADDSSGSSSSGH